MHVVDWEMTHGRTRAGKQLVERRSIESSFGVWQAMRSRQQKRQLMLGPAGRPNTLVGLVCYEPRVVDLGMCGPSRSSDSVRVGLPEPHIALLSSRATLVDPMVCPASSDNVQPDLCPQRCCSHRSLGACVIGLASLHSRSSAYSAPSCVPLA